MKHRKTHQFLLVLSGVDENTDKLADTLYRAGCDDALINTRNGVVYLDFDREAKTRYEAIASAIDNVEHADINVKVDHIEGEFVTLSDIAKRTNFSKQNISLLIKGQRGSGKFPIPFSGIDSKSPIWRWKEVAAWMVKNKKINDKQVIDDAELLDNFNRELDKRNKLAIKKRKNLLSAYHLTSQI